MVLQIELPDDVWQSLEERWRNLSRRVLESVAVDGFNESALTEFQVQTMLGLETRDEVEQFLKFRGAVPDYTVEDLQEDLETQPGGYGFLKHDRCRQHVTNTPEQVER